MGSSDRAENAVVMRSWWTETVPVGVSCSWNRRHSAESLSNLRTTATTSSQLPQHANKVGGAPCGNRGASFLCRPPYQEEDTVEQGRSQRIATQACRCATHRQHCPGTLERSGTDCSIHARGSSTLTGELSTLDLGAGAWRPFQGP